MKLLSTSLLLCFAVLLQAQSKYDYHWTIGYDTSLLDPGGDVILMNFNSNPIITETIKTVEKFSSEGATSTMSDTDGNLIFYTSGCYVVNAAHEIMENGDTITPGITQQYLCPGGSSGNLGGAIAIPWPDSPHLYLLFINDYESNLIPAEAYGGARHLHFNVIDMNKNGGLGAVSRKNQVAIQDTMAIASVEACRHANGRDWWILIPKSISNCYFLTLVTPDGVETPKLVCTGIPWERHDDLGQAFFTPDGKKFIRYNQFNGVHIYDFDDELGELSNEKWFAIQDITSNTGGASCSPNSRYLYITGLSKLFQYDLQAPDIEASRVLLAVPDNVPDPFVPSGFALAALGPDGKIYISSGSSHLSLHVIHRPDCPGLYSLPERRGLPLTSWNYYSIPNMPHFRNEPTAYSCDSMVVQTYTPRDGSSGIVVYPNPTYGRVMVYVNHPLPRPSTWVLHDQMGRLVKSIPLEVNMNEYEVFLDGLTPGIFYYAVITDSGIVQRGKLFLLSLN